MSGGGGSTTSTVTQSNLPAYAKPYYQSMMDRGLQESNRPYQSYQGQRLAGMSNETDTGLGMAENYAQSGYGQLPAAQNMAQQAGNQALALGNYNPANFTADNVTADQVGFQAFDSNVAQNYMSPYMQDVVNRAKQDVVQNTLDEQAMRNADFAKSGAFGGSRAAVQNQMAVGQAQERMMDLDVQGRQKAFENAQQQFERDRAAYMNAAGTNQDANLRAALANQGKNLEAQQLGEQSRQFGANLGLQGLEAAQRSAGLMGELQGQQEKMALDRIKSQLGVGQTREEYSQEQLDMAYNDFVNQRDANRQNLQFLSSLLQGVPVSANQDVTTTQPTNPIAGGLGTLAGLQALYQLGNS